MAPMFEVSGSDSNEFGIELKVDHIKDKLETAIKKAKDYTEEFEVDVYLVNFLVLPTTNGKKTGA